MVTEYTQLLSTAHRILDGKSVECKSKNGRKLTQWILDNPDFENGMYKATHINHPCAVWVRSSIENYRWLHNLYISLAYEYKFRYGKDHLAFVKTSPYLRYSPNNISLRCFFDPPVVMNKYPECVVAGDVVESYRNLYRNVKARFAVWKNVETPPFMPLIYSTGAAINL